MEGLVRVQLAEVLDRTYRARRVLITGHNGFVGTWLSSVLVEAGAEVAGLALEPETGGFAEAIDLGAKMPSTVADVGDAAAVSAVVQSFAPEAVFHLAAQALVLPSYEDPLATLTTNVMGTANVLEALRRCEALRAAVVVTSDKCYATAAGPHRESDPLGGEDPYSASKGAAEIVANCYRSSFFGGGVVATARAGNIVGGGDFSPFRIVPDCVRAVLAGEAVVLRRPGAVRPWQHVLDAVAGYLRLGDALLRGSGPAADAWNFGPDPTQAVTVATIVETFAERWSSLSGETVPAPTVEGEDLAPEREFLTLVSEKAASGLDWRQVLGVEDTVGWAAEWYHAAADGRAAEVTESQIARYLDVEASGVAAHDSLASGPTR